MHSTADVADHPATRSGDLLPAIRSVVEPDLEAVDRRIFESLHSRVPLASEIGGHLISRGGKRLRPLLVLLSAGAFDCREGRAHVDLATSVEFIHTATLLHDDVVDSSTLRRGGTTANAIWGNEASVLAGDFLFSRAFQLLVATGSRRIMAIMADTTNAIAEGEVLQLANRYDPDTSEARYLEVAGYKTGKLFEAAAAGGPVLAGGSERDEQCMAMYGMCVGTAYQLVDDILDYRGSAETIGKNVGDDLAEGKPTLPLIHVMRDVRSSAGRAVREAVRTGDLERLDVVIEAVEAAGGIEYTLGVARGYAQRAVEALRHVPDTRFRQALLTLVDFAIERTY